MAKQEPDLKLMQLVSALNETRDAWVMLGLQLRDFQFEMNSNKRDEVAAEVERYLARLRESDRRALD